MRLFTAIDLAPALRQPLVQLVAGLPRGRDVRWSTEQQLHVTLKFLGEVAETRLPEIHAAIAAASGQVAPCPLRLTGLGAFPSPRSPRVLWCGVDDPAGGCAAWMHAADPLFAELGFEPEARAYTPHITLGRSKSGTGAQAMREVLQTGFNPPQATMAVGEVTLFESRLRPSGAVYTALARFAFGAEAK